MSGKNPRITALQLRRQLLLAESELNRSQLIQEGRMLTDGVRAAASRSQSLGIIASSAGAVATALSALRSSRPPAPREKPSWLGVVLKGAGLLANLWFSRQPRPGKRTAD